MLRSIRAVALATGILLLLVGLPGVAGAEPPVACQQTDPRTGVCLVWASRPASSEPVANRSNGDGGSVGPADPDLCIFRLAEPQPALSSPIWAGHLPEDGAIWLHICPPPAGFTGQWIGLVFLPTGAAPAAGPPVDPRALAQQAVASMVMRAPQIGMAPSPGSASGLVGLPVWMWVERGEQFTGPTRASASAGGVTVTAVGEVTQVVWDMGDGHSVACGVGTSYEPGAHGDSPDCGYTYATASTNHVPGSGAWPVTATGTWTITWSGGGQSGTLTLTLSSTAALRIGELHVLNQDGGSR
jgi:hypothetical protein